MSENFDRIKKMGFTHAGSWTLVNDKLCHNLRDDVKASPNALYAFVVNDEVKYVGKTKQPVCQRVGDYQHPSRDRTKRRKKEILEHLKKSEPVEIYVFVDNGQLYYGGFHLNLGAGLEDSLIDELNPPWNRGKKIPTKGRGNLLLRHNLFTPA